MPRPRHDLPHSSPAPHSSPEPHADAQEHAEMIHRCQAGLRLLFDGSSYARELGRDRWEFAVEIEFLNAAGLTNNDLRWLAAKGYVEHALETTAKGKTRRSSPAGRLPLPPGSCFVLTDAGVELTRAVLALPEPAIPQANSDVPHWDAATHSLSWRGQLIKHFKHEAPFQEAILDAFQASNWSRYVLVALPKEEGINPKVRLRGAIRNLNRGCGRCIRFTQEGNGGRVAWQPVA
jgi:hypothetical protein